jgi:hypothetical protein
MAFAAYDGPVAAGTPRPSSRGHLVATPTVDPGFLNAAVVTGAPESLLDAAIALKNEGFDILGADWEADALGADIPVRTIGCYVQYPPVSGPAEGRPFAVATAVLAGEMVARFDAMARIGPLLTPGAAVVLVVGEHLAEASRGCALDLRDFVEVFAEAVERDLPDVTVLVVDETLGAPEISAIARRCATPPAHWSAYAEIEPEMAYADWRDEVLAIIS